MSKKLYDLCRKYKYFYKKHEDVKKWDKKYYDIDLSEIIVKIRFDMELVENELQRELFDVFKVTCTNIECENECSMGYRFGDRSIPFPLHTTSTIELKDSNRFVKSLTDYMRENWWGH